MDTKLVGIGVAAGVLVTAAWAALPGHAFKLKVLEATSPTGEAEKSPLASIEHYHWGLASIIASPSAGQYEAVLDGFGASMIASEFLSDHPFGVGKSREEAVGNMILGSVLTGLLLIRVGGAWR